MCSSVKCALVGAFSVVVKTDCGTDGALHSTTNDTSTASDLRHGSQTTQITRISAGIRREVTGEDTQERTQPFTATTLELVPSENLLSTAILEPLQNYN